MWNPEMCHNTLRLYGPPKSGHSIMAADADRRQSAREHATQAGKAGLNSSVESIKHRRVAFKYDKPRALRLYFFNI